MLSIPHTAPYQSLLIYPHNASLVLIEVVQALSMQFPVLPSDKAPGCPPPRHVVLHAEFILQVEIVAHQGIHKKGGQTIRVLLEVHFRVIFLVFLSSKETHC